MCALRQTNRLRAERGFTLIELMIVVILVGILAVLAVPSMTDARYERHAYEDAAATASVFRTARTRAIARGAAMLVAATGGASGRGRYTMYEARVTAANAAGSALPLNSPMSTCGAPTVWLGGNATSVIIDGTDLNGAVEAQGGITSVLNDYLTPGVPVPSGYVCYTPLGRAFYSAGNTAFTAANVMTGMLVIPVTRGSSKLVRSVLVPPSGAARVYSQVQ